MAEDMATASAENMSKLSKLEEERGKSVKEREKLAEERRNLAEERGKSVKERENWEEAKRNNTMIPLAKVNGNEHSSGILASNRVSKPESADGSDYGSASSRSGNEAYELAN